MQTRPIYGAKLPCLLLTHPFIEAKLALSVRPSTPIYYQYSLLVMSGFEDYSEFLTADYHSAKSKPCSDRQYFPNTEYQRSPTDIDAMLKKKFEKTQFPVDPLSANYFCPICSKEVKAQEACSIYKSDTFRRNFLAHDLCLTQENSRLLSDVFDEIEEMSLAPAVLSKKERVLNLSDREFCLELSISHPLSNCSFMKLVTKQSPESNVLRWQLKQAQEEDSELVFSYQPNMICFPFVDFNVVLTHCEIGIPESKKTFKNYVNMSRLKLGTVNSLVASYMGGEVKIEFNLYKSNEQKSKAIKEMNYKYRYSPDMFLPIVEMVAIEITIPEEYDNEADYNEESSHIMDLINDNHQDASSYCSYSSTYGGQLANFDHASINSVNSQKRVEQPSELESPSRQGRGNKSQESMKSQARNHELPEKEKIDLEKMLQANKLSSYVRANTSQSRTFQNFLKEEASPEQVQLIIQHLYDQLADLITDEYANYMVQELFKVSLPQQRLAILGKLYPDIPRLVRNKQGTHTVQAFLDYLQESEESEELICKAMEAEFVKLCSHPISTHFVQKIINSFPVHLTVQFYEAANEKFVQFATDKNAMCVLKYMLKKIKALESDPQVVEIRKHFINSITFNTEKIIEDCYGNYVVQFCYETLGESKSSAITENIIERFVPLSLQKYSASVILKCINIYWTDHSYVDRLKDSLRPDGILEMFRNKEGNKILLDLMDRNEGTLLWEKIYHVLVNAEVSSFYYDRWGPIFGCRSGPAGIEFRSFSEADHAHQRKSTYSNKNSKKSRKR